MIGRQHIKHKLWHRKGVAIPGYHLSTSGHLAPTNVSRASSFSHLRRSLTVLRLLSRFNLESHNSLLECSLKGKLHTSNHLTSQDRTSRSNSLELHPASPIATTQWGLCCSTSEQSGSPITLHTADLLLHLSAPLHPHTHFILIFITPSSHAILLRHPRTPSSYALN